VLITFLWLVPAISSVITAIRTNDDILTRGFWAFPKEFVLTNFKTAWERGGLNRFIPNSFIITLPSLVFTLFLSSLSAYALSRFRFPGNRFFYFLFIGGMMLPFQVLLLPVFLLTNALGLYDTYWGLIAFHTAFQLGFCTFVLRNYMLTVPVQIFEAARIDGCNEVRIWWQIMLPLTVPAMAAIATLEFTWIFNDYLWAIILVRSEKRMPVTAGHYGLDRYCLWCAACIRSNNHRVFFLAALLYRRIDSRLEQVAFVLFSSCAVWRCRATCKNGAWCIGCSLRVRVFTR
jgi:multiple sugar transport system permease protein